MMMVLIAAIGEITTTTTFYSLITFKQKIESSHIQSINSTENTVPQIENISRVFYVFCKCQIIFTKTLDAEENSLQTKKVQLYLHIQEKEKF